MATLYIRNVDPGAHDSLRVKAAARGWTIGKLIAALDELHDCTRQIADDGDAGMMAALVALGLETKKH